MKNVLLLMIGLLMTFPGFSNNMLNDQKEATSETQVKNEWKIYFKEYNRLVENMKCCFFIKDCPKDCGDFSIDFPDKMPPIKLASTVIKAPKAPQLQKDIAAWEKGILEGRGGKKIPKKMVQMAFKKFNGYSEKAVQSRFKLYEKRMEMKFDDDDDE